jgi:two-component system chemotaxis response regulator CheB
MALRPGQLYVAPPDRHMLVMDGHIRLTRGPKEHFTRPAIDPLFLAAALAWGPAVVGVILTGSLEDGTVGLKAVKACGGATVVQDPANAEAPSMPASALKYVEVDYCGPIGGLGSAVVSLLDRQASKSSTPRAPLPPSLIHEQDIALSKGDPIEHLDAIARPSTFTCPDCHGSLWQLNEGRPVRYRCHTGHAYTLETLQRTLLQSTDEALWGALRALQEQALVLDMLAQAHRADGNEHDARRVEQTRDAMARQADTLRLLVERQPDAVL